MTLFESRILADVIKLRGFHTRQEGALNPVTGALSRRMVDSETGDHMKMEAENGVMHVQAKEHQGLLRAT